MKKLLLIIVALFFLFILVSILGWYPVAIVNGRFISYSAWRLAEHAERQFINTQKVKNGGKAINLNEPAASEFLVTIRRSTLTFLIEDTIFKEEGGRMIHGFAQESQERVSQALGFGQNVAEAAKALYGLTQEDFIALVLLPQARRDVIREYLTGQGKGFDEWALEIKKKAHVQLFLVPFTWDGEEVK